MKNEFPKTGRPHKFAGGSVVKTNITLSKDQHEWLKAQPQGVSGTIQNLVDARRRRSSDNRLRDQILASLRENARYWAELPDKTARQRCDGTTFSILAILDGCADLTAFDLVTGDGRVVSDMLHEYYYQNALPDREDG